MSFPCIPTGRDLSVHQKNNPGPFFGTDAYKQATRATICFGNPDAANCGWEWHLTMTLDLGLSDGASPACAACPRPRRSAQVVDEDSEELREL